MGSRTKTFDTTSSPQSSGNCFQRACASRRKRR
ncbi:Uncharacterised protein [Bordetella pertussis]|nr:Uncharacterised protein [Bordetella pertussis]